jgi:hypothetical protein
VKKWKSNSKCGLILGKCLQSTIKVDMCWILLRLGVIQLDVVVVQQTLEKAPRRRRESMLVKVKERDNVVVHRPWFTLVPRLTQRPDMRDWDLGYPRQGIHGFILL